MLRTYLITQPHEWRRALRCVGGAEPCALESAQAGQARTARIQTTDHTDVGTHSRPHFRSAARAATTVYWLASCAARTWRVRFLGLGLGLADGRRSNEMRRRKLVQDLPVELERALRRTTPVGVHLQQRADARDQQLVGAPCCVTCAACRRPTPSAISEQIGRVCMSHACVCASVPERLCVCVSACARACARARVCVHARMCTCARSCLCDVDPWALGAPPRRYLRDIQPKSLKATIAIAIDSGRTEILPVGEVVLSDLVQQLFRHATCLSACAHMRVRD